MAGSDPRVSWLHPVGRPLVSSLRTRLETIMKRSIRSRVVVSVATVLATVVLAACSGGSSEGPADVSGTGAFGSIPEPTGTAASGGTVDVALPPGLAPNYIYPNVPAASNGSQVAPSQLWRPLYWRSTGASSRINLDLSLAELPTYSNDRKTVTIKLKDTMKWSDGEPVVADDLVFSVELIRAALAESPTNWSYYTPGQFPDDLESIEATSGDTVTLVLSNTYNSEYFNNLILGNLVPLPAHSWSKASDEGDILDFTDPANAKAVFNYLHGASQDQKTFATNPLWKTVNGPFVLDSFDSATGTYSLVPNEQYAGPSPSKLDVINFKTFTSASAVFNQLRNGSLTVAQLDSVNINQLPELERTGYNYYGMPKDGQVNSLFINFENTTNNFDKIIAQPYVRQALQHLIDQKGYIQSKGIYNGAAAESYSPVAASSPYAPSFGAKAPYGYSIEAATELLEDHGWEVVPDGETTCVDPGTGAGQCGAGIPEGQDISFNLFYASSPSTIAARNTAFVSAAKKIGVNIEASAKATNFMYENYDNNFAPQNKDKWAMQDAGPINLGGYPTSGLVWSTEGAYNGGHYSNEKADALINASVTGASKEALSEEATFLGEDLPVLFMPNPANIVVWKKDLSGEADAFANLTQNFQTPEFWYYTEK